MVLQKKSEVHFLSSLTWTILIIFRNIFKWHHYKGMCINTDIKLAAKAKCGALYTKWYHMDKFVLMMICTWRDQNILIENKFLWFSVVGCQVPNIGTELELVTTLNFFPYPYWRPQFVSLTIFETLFFFRNHIGDPLPYLTIPYLSLS